MSTFNETLVHELCLQYQADPQPATLKRIDEECNGLFHAIIKTGKYGDPATLRSGLRGRLPLWIGRADFSKGKAYIWFSTCARSYRVGQVNRDHPMM